MIHDLENSFILIVWLCQYMILVFYLGALAIYFDPSIKPEIQVDSWGSTIKEHFQY